MHNPISFTIDSVSAIVGENMSIEEWAEKIPIPHRRKPGVTLTGGEIKRITGVERKSWDVERFSNFDSIVEVTLDAMNRANAKPEDIDLVLILTATPFYIQLDMDAF